VLGYFAFLSVLIAVPFVGGTMDTFRISEFREKRQVRFRASIQRVSQVRCPRLETNCKRSQEVLIECR